MISKKDIMLRICDLEDAINYFSSEIDILKEKIKKLEPKKTSTKKKVSNETKK